MVPISTITPCKCPREATTQRSLTCHPHPLSCVFNSLAFQFFLSLFFCVSAITAFFCPLFLYSFSYICLRPLAAHGHCVDPRMTLGTNGVATRALAGILLPQQPKTDFLRSEQEGPCSKGHWSPLLEAWMTPVSCAVSQTPEALEDRSTCLLQGGRFQFQRALAVPVS